MTVGSVKVGQSKSFMMYYEDHTVLDVRITSKRFDLSVMFSFDGTIPNSRKHDFFTLVKPGAQKTGTLIKPPS